MKFFNAKTPWIFSLAALLCMAMATAAVFPAPVLAAPAQEKSAQKSPLKKPAAKKPLAKKTAIKKNSQKNHVTKKTSAKKTLEKKSAAVKNKTALAAQKKSARKAARAAEGDLAQVQEQIKSAETRIKLTQAERDQKEDEVRLADQEIGTLKSSLSTVQTDMQSKESRLRALNEERTQKTQDKTRLLNAIKTDLQIAQRQGGQDYYKLLLNQQNPQTLARQLKYYEYLQKARALRVQALNQTVSRLNTIASEEVSGVQHLQSLNNELTQKQSKLAQAQEQRAQAIRLLSSQILSDAERLKQLRRDQQNLQAVMDRLAREAANRDAEERRLAYEKSQEKPAEKKTEPSAEKSLASGNGNTTQKNTAQKNTADKTASEKTAEKLSAQNDYKLLPYAGACRLPVSGDVRAAFGSARAGGLRWNGIVIAAPAGTAVRAVRAGRVAFADYLRGYGFLIIVDHGRGLMSLYGQNQNLQKKSGDSVGGNEVIATVGDSVGSDAAGLYFEIRSHGRPSDPAKWCSFQ